MDATGDENEGLSSRRNLMGEEKNIDMIGYLHCDVFKQDKLLINGVEVRVRFVRSRDSFCLMDRTGLYTARITEASLFVRRVRLSLSIILAHEKGFRKQLLNIPSHVYKLKLLQCIVVFIEKHWIIVGFVENKAFNGDKNLKPFNFKNFNINYLCLYIDGV